jgi:hypothetical protein
MVNNDNNAQPAKRQPPPEVHYQNWGLMIGVGTITLCMLIMVINLTIYEPKSRLWESVPAVTLTYWFRIVRVVGLAGSLGGGGWLLWRLLRRRPTGTYLALHLQQAMTYTQKIEELLEADAKGHEQQLLSHIQTWWQTIETMARTLTDLSQNDTIIQNDLRNLPGAIIDLEHQLASETNPLLRSDLEQMLTQRQHHRQALAQLQTTRRRAEIQIERTIVVLGTIYSQLLTYRSTFHMTDYQHLTDEVAEEVQHLQDYLEALQEVKGNRSRR